MSARVQEVLGFSYSTWKGTLYLPEIDDVRFASFAFRVLNNIRIPLHTNIIYIYLMLNATYNFRVRIFPLVLVLNLNFLNSRKNISMHGHWNKLFLKNNNLFSLKNPGRRPPEKYAKSKLDFTKERINRLTDDCLV